MSNKEVFLNYAREEMNKVHFLIDHMDVLMPIAINNPFSENGIKISSFYETFLNEFDIGLASKILSTEESEDPLECYSPKEILQIMHMLYVLFDKADDVYDILMKHINELKKEDSNE